MIYMLDFTVWLTLWSQGWAKMEDPEGSMLA